jgi:hypothetical protein
MASVSQAAGRCEYRVTGRDVVGGRQDTGIREGGGSSADSIGGGATSSDVELSPRPR